MKHTGIAAALVWTMVLAAGGSAGLAAQSAVSTSAPGAQEDASMKTYHNPVITGMNPDPSICRVGDDFYLVTSTFEYYPGLPVYHSKDLVHWRLIGHALDSPYNCPLMGAESAVGGNYAPTLRWHDGTFYVVCTNYGGQGSQGVFYVTAKDPAGPWSDPVWVGNWYVDPSISFDDGLMYWLSPNNKDGFLLGTFDPVQEDFVEPLTDIAKGLGGSSPEGPHMYKIGDWYYLMSAEGGTGFQHREVIQRSKSPWGPYEASPMNPVLSNAKKPRHPIQAIGHADLVQLQDGSWWAVCLGIRPQPKTAYHHLGRETFLAPITWSADGWPRVGSTGLVEEEYPLPPLASHPWPAAPVRDDFDQTKLGLDWQYVRNPHSHNYSLSERPGYLRLKGSAVSFVEKDSPAFVGRRQTAFDMVASTSLDFVPGGDNEEAGLVLRSTDKNHYDLVITQAQGKRVVVLRKVLDGQVAGLESKAIPDGEVILRVRATAQDYRFEAQVAGEKVIDLGSAATKELSTEKVGGFTGTFIGLYASGNGKSNTAYADFAWFDYQAKAAND